MIRIYCKSEIKENRKFY